MSAHISRFLDALFQSFTAGTLIKATLSHHGPSADPELKNVYIRPVVLKSGQRLAFTFRFRTRDEVKNHTPEEARQLLELWLGPFFRNADLLTIEKDLTLRFQDNGALRLREQPPSHQAPPDTRHDRFKQRLLEPSAPWLHALGITGAKGEVLAASQDKWRQINKFLEIVDTLLQIHALPPDPVVVDMGSGKGYLTFALWEYLTMKAGLRPTITGVELRPALVNHCNKVAQTNGFDGLHFVATDIRDFPPGPLDLLIALHACDTATDLALAEGVRRHAKILLAAPCCHKQVRKAMHTSNEMAPLLRHGILEERQAEILTDGIRALLLEAEGYRTKVFEFISTEHTAKNLMITAVAGGKPKPEAREQVQALKASYGISEHYLETLL